jgi:hypothetical protein
MGEKAERLRLIAFNEYLGLEDGDAGTGEVAFL